MKTIITGALQATAEELEQLRTLGLEITLHRDEKAEVDNPEQFEAAVCNGLFLYNDISKFKNLKYIQLTSAGMDRVPLDYTESHGIEVHNAAGVYSVPMAEWTIMRILELYKNANKLFKNQKAHRWEKGRNWQELAGKTSCFVGFGAYGQETAKRLKAFDVNVQVVNRSQKTSPFVDLFYSMDELDVALSKADIVIMAIALTSETAGLIGEKQFSRMKNTAILINAARGALIDECALVEALCAGKIAGAALDVFEEEPLQAESQLWKMENAFISSHNSFVGEKNHQRLMKVIETNLLASKITEE